MDDGAKDAIGKVVGVVVGGVKDAKDAVGGVVGVVDAVDGVVGVVDDGVKDAIFFLRRIFIFFLSQLHFINIPSHSRPLVAHPSAFPMCNGHHWQCHDHPENEK